MQGFIPGSITPAEMDTTQPMHIALAGNIGSGKTTLAELLARELGWNVQYEDPEDNPYIVDFYSDMNRWAFHMQVYFLNSRLNQTHKLQQSGQPTVQDRTLYEDAEIFTPNLLSMGLMTQREYDTYDALYKTVIQSVRPPDLVIYLRASISTLVDQIAARNRQYEDSIRIDYLKRLNERYEAWFTNYSLGKKLEIVVDEVNFRDRPEDLGVVLSRVNAELFGLFH